MKTSPLVRLSLLVISLAIASPNLTAQLAPTANYGSNDAFPVGLSPRPVSQSPPWAYTRPTEKEK